VSANPPFTVEYLEPVIEAEPLPEEFSPSNLRRSLVIIGALALVVVALIVLVPGLASLRAPARATCWCSAASSAGA
jgi:hypothetical protein